MACRHPYLQHMGSVVVACGLQSTGLIGVVQRLSQSRACEIFMDQGSNPCLLHRQADSLPLNHKGSPRHLHFKSCDVLNITLICSMLAAFCFLYVPKFKSFAVQMSCMYHFPQTVQRILVIYTGVQERTPNIGVPALPFPYCMAVASYLSSLCFSFYTFKM